MEESENNIQAVLAKLTAHLESIERKVDNNVNELGRVR
jgi:hypothetical protein